MFWENWLRCKILHSPGICAVTSRWIHPKFLLQLGTVANPRNSSNRFLHTFYVFWIKKWVSPENKCLPFRGMHACSQIYESVLLLTLNLKSIIFKIIGVLLFRSSKWLCCRFLFSCLVVKNNYLHREWSYVQVHYPGPTERFQRWLGSVTKKQSMS